MVCETRALTKKEVKAAFAANGDGAGIAWQDGSRIRYRKGLMKISDVIQSYFEYRLCENLPHVIHFRRASNKVTQSLTHPFIVSDTSNIKLVYNGTSSVLFHNGVMNDWRNRMLNFYLNNSKRIPNGDFSDSRFIAILTHFLGPNILTILGDKFVHFTLEGIETYGEFVSDDGIYASNESYKSGRVVYTTSQLRAEMGKSIKSSNKNPMNILDCDNVDDLDIQDLLAERNLSDL